MIPKFVDPQEEHPMLSNHFRPHSSLGKNILHYFGKSHIPMSIEKYSENPRQILNNHRLL